MTPPTLLILAAGMASRYGGFKLSDPVGPYDETIVEYSIYDARRAGFGKIVFVIAESLSSASRRLSVHGFCGTSPSNMSFRTSSRYRVDSPFREAAPSPGVQLMRFLWPPPPFMNRLR